MIQKTISLILLAAGLSISAALGFSTDLSALARNFDTTSATTSAPVVVTATFTNGGGFALRGFGYTEQIPSGLAVTVLNLSLNGQSVTNYTFESGLDGDVYAGCTPYRWVLEQPTGFTENNPVSANFTVRIQYTITSPTVGSFNLQQFSWVGYNAANTNAAFGYSEGSDAQSVSFTAGSPPSYPILTTATSGMIFSTTPGINPANQTLGITNSGGGTLNWTAVADGTSPVWLTVNPTNGTGNGAVTVSVASASLAAGVYSKAITVNAVGATNSPQTVTVSLAVTVSNPVPVQGLVCYWTLDEGLGTTANDASGSGNHGSLFNSPTWTAGKMSGALAFNGVNNYVSTAALNLSGTRAVSLALWVNRTYSNAGGHTLFESPANFNSSTTGFGFFPDDSSTCSGGGMLVGVRGNAGYNLKCYAQPSSGVWHHLVAVFDKGQSALNEVSLYIDGVLQTANAQRYSSNNTNSFGTNPLYLMSRGGSGEFNAGVIDDFRVYNRALSVAEVQQLYALGTTPVTAPMLAVSPGNLTFSAVVGTSPVNQVLGITNAGGGALIWTAVADGSAPAWLTVSPTSGTGNGTVSVLVASAGLTSGNYTKTVTVTAVGATNSPQTMTVNLTVNPPVPSLTVSPTALNFGVIQGTDPANQIFGITNNGGGTLNWTVVANGSAPSWLTISPTNGTGNGAVTVSVASASLDLGNYAKSITVTATGASNSPQTVTVNLAVTPPNQPPVANADSYNVVAGAVLTINAPGVLGNDTDADGNLLSTVLVSGVAHGNLNLSADGAFTYTPVTGYSGPDSFSYKANDGAADGGIATVTFTVTPPVNRSPVANADSYSVAAGAVLTVNAPGVLGNDADADGNPLIAVLVSGVAHGILSLSANGAFIYTPAAGYSGSDSFTYKANDGAADSDSATVSLTVTPLGGGILFTEDFTRPTNPGLLSPWVAAVGTWSVTGGMLNGSSAQQSYSFACVNNSWTDYSVACRVRFPAAAYGGGLGGRLNLTGGHYAAWVYPEGSVGGSRVLKLKKQRDWTSWSGTPMAQVTLASVGTNWHTLKMIFEGTRIRVFYDGSQVIAVTDNGFDGRAAYLSGGINAGVWNYTTPYTMNMDDVVVNALGNLPPVANAGSYSVAAGVVLTINAPGVLGNDTDADGNSLSTVLVGGVAHGTLNLSASGAFTYMPVAGYSGPDSFSYKANDGAADSGIATVTLTVTPTVNQPPVANADSYSVAAGAILYVSAPGVLGNDTDADGNSLNAGLVSNVAHGILSLSSNGAFTYTPAAGYSGPDSFTYKANDGAADSGIATVTLTVTPQVNQPPVANADSYSVAADVVLTINAPGVLVNDTDADSNPLNAVLVSGVGQGILSLSTNGAFTYSPAAGYSGPDSFTYKANDGAANSGVATVSLTVTPSGGDILFADDFTRATNPGPLSPWVTAIGTWSVTGGVMQGKSALQSYGAAYVNTNWTDYSVEGRFQFPVGAYGGGLGGRVAPTTGAHYAAWVYPEGSVGGSRVLKLKKHPNWISWSHTPMAEVTLANVGTNWHTLKMTFEGTRIRIYYDKIQVMDVTDNNFDGQAAYLSGGISVGLWSYTTTYTMNVDDLVVSATGSSSSAAATGAQKSVGAALPGPVKIESLIVSSQGQVRITLRALAGQTFTVQASTNLESWNDLGTVQSLGESAEFVDVDATNHQYRFYRAKPF